jgi:hypothetical protein
MSTAKFDTLQNAAGTKSVPVSTVVDGSAKAWVNFNGTGTVAIRASFNVSSITDNGTGDYTVNFTNAMTDANYAAVGMSQAVIGSTVAIPVGGVTFNTSSVRVRATSGSTFYDGDTVSVSIFR